MGIGDKFRGFVNTLRGERKPPVDELAKIGVYTIADVKAERREKERKEFNEKLSELGLPIEEKDVLKRVGIYRARLTDLYDIFKRVAVPYLRTMDSNNNHFAWGLKVLEHMYAVTMTYLGDFERIFKSDMSNKEEVLAGMEYWIVAYIKSWIETFYDWSYGGLDMSPNYSITVQSPMLLGQHTLPAGLGPGFQQPNPEQQRD